MLKLWNEKIPYYRSEIDFIPHIVPFPKEHARIAVLICPGGGYEGLCSSYEGEEVAEWLNSIGISAFVLNYRIKPYSDIAIASDVQRAMRVLRSNANEWQIEKIGVLGFSAGGHLAGIASVHYHHNFYENTDKIDEVSAKPDFSILCYPVIDMYEYSHFETRKNITGDCSKIEILDFYSLHKQVDKNTPPAFLWHTCADEMVPAENSMLYAAALSKNGVPYELHIYPYGAHGYSLAKDDEYIKQWTCSLEKWLKEYILADKMNIRTEG